MANQLTKFFRNPIQSLSNLVTRPVSRTDDLNMYFGPGVEVAPIAPKGTEPRGWQYWPFQNQTYTPRPDAIYTAQQLRTFATYFVARICIENCKDVLTQMPRQIRAVKKPGETNKDVDKRSQGDATLKMLNGFFDYPDGEHDWERWLREWLEGVYVGDWASINMRRKRNGSIYQARVVDGAFINRQIDEFGYTPLPPQTAYQMLWSGTPSTVGGIPYTDMTTDQLLYWPRNIVPRNTVASYLYGFSPTEQGAEEIQLGQNRLNMWVLWYTAGVMPDAIHVVPPSITPDKLKEAQKALNSEMSGQLYKRSGAIRLLQGFVDREQPGGSSGDQFIFPKEKMLSDPFDDMHLRKMAFLYGSSVQRLMKQMNRASAQSSQESAEEEGTMPIAASVRAMVNFMIAKYFKLGANSYELTFDEAKELDPLKRAQTDQIYVNAGIRTRNQVREALGDDPVDDTPEADELMITTASGAVPLSTDKQMEIAQQKQDMQDASAQNQDAQSNAKKVAKRRVPRIDPGLATPDTRQAHARLENELKKIFKRQSEKAVEAAQRVLKMRKDDDPEKKADQINDAIKDEWNNLPILAREALEQAALSGISDAMLQLEITDGKFISSANLIASEYASKRAAEMVGMKYNAAVELVPNPNAKWVISDTTRDRLRQLVTNAFEEKTPMSRLIEDIRTSDAFSDTRAKMIANTEVSTAQVQSNFKVWEDAGVAKVKWLALGPEPCPTCTANDGQVRKIGENFPGGQKMPLAHPNCLCILTAVGFKN